VKPFRRTELLPAIEEVLARCRQEWAIEEEAAALRGTDGAAEDKIATRRVVDQAKSALMDHHDLAENEAFTFIQQTAMQHRARMRDVAQQIVDGTLTP
jgi:response regulator NasT